MPDQAAKYIMCHCLASQTSWPERMIVDPDVIMECPECGKQHRIGDIGQMVIIGGEQADEWHWLSEQEWRTEVANGQ